MGLKDARRALIAALRSGDFQHEARHVISEKNLLAVGDISEDDVIHLLQRTRGRQYSTGPHDWDPTTTVHVFQPRVGGVGWYIKAYFLTEEIGRAVFISVHT